MKISDVELESSRLPKLLRKKDIKRVFLESIDKSGVEECVTYVLLRSSILTDIFMVLWHLLSTLKIELIFDRLTKYQSKSIPSEEVFFYYINKNNTKWPSIIIITVLNFLCDRSYFIFLNNIS